MKKLWILNHHSGLEGDRHFELAREFVSQGVEVVVFMSSYSHRGEKYLYEKETITGEEFMKILHAEEEK